jgi:hypothetical protein
MTTPPPKPAKKKSFLILTSLLLELEPKKLILNEFTLKKGMGLPWKK